MAWIRLTPSPQTHNVIIGASDRCSRPQFGGVEEEKIKQAVGTFCSNQPFALEIIKSKQKKDSRFASFVQVGFASHLAECLFVCLFVWESARKKSLKVDRAPFEGNHTSSNTFSLCSHNTVRTPKGKKRKKKKKRKLLPGDHLTYFIRLPFRKRRVTDCVADCSSKILFPSRCCGSPNTPCCSRTSQSTQVPYRTYRVCVSVRVWGAICSAFYVHAATSHGSRRRLLNLAGDGTRRWMRTDVGFGGRYRMSPTVQTKHFTTAARQ